MKIRHILCAVALSSSCVFASNDLTLVPTHTNGFERNFNPFDATVGSFYATDFVYEPLWIFNVWNPDNDYPRLAESVSLSSDYRSVTYRLRDGVLWSDGTPFTAQDVVFTANYAKQHPNYNINISMFDDSNNNGLVTAVTALDNLTVRFDLAAPSALAHQTIGRLYPLPKHIFETVEDPVKYLNVNPVGTGPFTEVNTFRTTHFKLCRNPYYYQASQLKVDCLKFPHYSGNEQLWAAARMGKIDWMGEGIHEPGSQYSDHLETNKVWLAPGAATVMQVNTTKDPLSNVKLRQALSMAIDRNHLLEVDTFGLTSPMSWPVATGPLYKSWYNADELGQYKRLMDYNPTAAQQLLDAAGFADVNGDGWRDSPSGEEFEIGIAVPSGWTDWFNSVLTIAENYRAIGINAKVEGMDEQKWFERIGTGDFDIFMMWTAPGITPWKIYNEMFNPIGMVPGRVDGQAMHQMESPEVSRWLSDFTLTDDSQIQHELIGKIQKTVAENLPVISLFANPIWYQYSTRKFTGWVTEENPYVRPQVHKGVPERLIHVLNLRPVEN
jgi:peptide/nickel transport system substrate-binding protein